MRNDEGWECDSVRAWSVPRRLVLVWEDRAGI